MQRPERFRKKLNKLQITKLPNSKMYQKRQTKREERRGEKRGEGRERALPELLAGNLPNENSIFLLTADCNCWQTVCLCLPFLPPTCPLYHAPVPLSSICTFRRRLGRTSGRRKKCNALKLNLNKKKIHKSRAQHRINTNAVSTESSRVTHDDTKGHSTCHSQ